jgi:xanthine phosphoribosyltransferase
MERDLAAIYREMHLDSYVPDIIVGITRGGLIPAVYMSHYFNKPLNTLEVSFRDSGVTEQPTQIIDHIRNGKKVLIVDDILDSGETIDWIYQQVNSFNLKYVDFLKTAVLFHNEGKTGLVDPDYQGTVINKIENNVWIVFPWEK